MALEQTLSIIKPDGVGKNHIGEIISRFEKSGLRVIAAKMKHLKLKDAEGFYAVHKERPFFNDLVSFMITGPVMVLVLEGENAISKNRDIMGATDPKKAARGRYVPTLQKQSMKMLSMDPMLLRQQKWKFLISLNPKKFVQGHVNFYYLDFLNFKQIRRNL